MRSHRVDKVVDLTDFSGGEDSEDVSDGPEFTGRFMILCYVSISQLVASNMGICTLARAHEPMGMAITLASGFESL